MKKTSISLVMVIGIILMTAGLLACKPEPESITIVEMPYEANGLFYIAQEQGLLHQ